MVAVPPGSLVLVTGASGFIGAHTVKAFLDAGYPVRGTVRSVEKGEYLSKLFKTSKSAFSYAIVEDIEKPHSFDEVVRDVVGVAHTASPFYFTADDPQELIGPAVGGTVGILTSIQKNNPNVKRVVLTSSIAAILDHDIKPPHAFTEADWNTKSPVAVAAHGRDVKPPFEKYLASKTLAERALWEFLESEKPSWDAATICPPMVLGPIIHQVSKPEALNTSVSIFYPWLKGKKTQEDLKSPQTYSLVDVREVAMAHVLALTKPEASNNRFICNAGLCSAHDFCLTIHQHYPHLKNVPVGDASVRATLADKTLLYDGSKIVRMLGLKYRPVEETCKDMADSLVQRFGL